MARNSFLVSFSLAAFSKSFGTLPTASGGGCSDSGLAGTGTVRRPISLGFSGLVRGGFGSKLLANKLWAVTTELNTAIRMACIRINDPPLG
jgi:hypothetical protein